jgi:hypothetical protein
MVHRHRPRHGATEPLPGRAWFWALHIIGAHRAGVATSGYAASLEDAKAAFRASMERYRAWAQDSDSPPS